MEILWLAIVLYSVGLGLVLHFKPALMFNEAGAWKEFGYQRSSGPRSRHTMFPFWLFAIAWAFLSYAIAAGISWVIPTAAVASAANSFNSYAQSEYSDAEEEDIPPAVAPRGRGRPRKTPRPGYYVVDPESEKEGLRKYIYYGSEPPSE
jgi:hypothetical protein